MRTATGSALIACGGTRVICTAAIEEGVPRWRAGSGKGWLTAEYGMLPGVDRASASSATRRAGEPDGRTVEIQRLIGRSLRGVVDFAALGERTIWIDCDVLEADGGTRCASITGGYVALALGCARLIADGALERSPLTQHDRGRLVRDRRRRAAARPRLPRGLDGRGRRERRDDRRRRAASRSRRRPRARRWRARTSTSCSALAAQRDRAACARRRTRRSRRAAA